MRLLDALFLQYLWCQARFAHSLVEVDKNGTIAENEFVDADLNRVHETAFYGVNDLPDAAVNSLANLEETLGLIPGQTQVDARSGRIASLSLHTPIFPGNGVGNNLLWSVGFGNDNDSGPPQDHEKWSELGVEAVKSWIIENEALLNVDASGELFASGTTRTGVHGDGDTIQLSIPRTFKNIPVVGSRASATIKLGNLIHVGFEQWGTIPDNFSVEPRLTIQAAYAKLANHAGRMLSGSETCKPQLQILTMAKGNVPSANGQNSQNSSDFGNGYKYSLVWKVCPMFQGQEHEMMEGYVDARNGKVYSFVDEVDYFQAVGDVYPSTNDGKAPDGVLKADWPMPYMTVGSETTDTGGNYFNSGTQTAIFSGPYVRMVDNCGSASLTQSGRLDWGGSGGTDCKYDFCRLLLRSKKYILSLFA